MSNPVYSQTGSMDTPVMVPGWTVQSGGYTEGSGNFGEGSNQALTAATPPSGGIVQPQTAPANDTDTSTFSSATPTTLNDVIAALKTAGVFH